MTYTYHLHFIKEDEINMDSGYHTVFHETIYAASYEKAKEYLLEKYKNDNIEILS